MVQQRSILTVADTRAQTPRGYSSTRGYKRRLVVLEILCLFS